MSRVYKLVCGLVNNQPLIERPVREMTMMRDLLQKISENTYFNSKRIYS